MNSILANLGLTAIAILIIYIIKKIDDYFFNKKTGADVSDKVFKAAKTFAQGGSADEIRNILLNCIDFDEEGIEEVLLLSYPHKTDNDGGYHAFLEAVKKELVNY